MYSNQLLSLQVQPKKPGPYGPGKDNFKCEKSSESLYVTKVSYTTDTKCFTVFKVDCDQSYTTGKVRPTLYPPGGKVLSARKINKHCLALPPPQDIGSRKECNEFTRTKCRTVFDTSSVEKYQLQMTVVSRHIIHLCRCHTIYKKQCEMVYETVTDWEYQQKCTTQYEKKCHGYGYHQVDWKNEQFYETVTTTTRSAKACPKRSASRCPRRWSARCRAQSARTCRTRSAKTCRSTCQGRSAESFLRPSAQKIPYR